MLPIDFTRVNFLVAIAVAVAATAVAPASADTTEREFTMNFNINGLVTLIHFARQRRIEDFQKKPYVSLLKMYGARYFLTSFLETLQKNKLKKILFGLTFVFDKIEMDLLKYFIKYQVYLPARFAISNLGHYPINFI